MDTYELLLDQTSPYLQYQFLELSTNLQERVSQAGMECQQDSASIVENK